MFADGAHAHESLTSPRLVSPGPWPLPELRLSIPGDLTQVDTGSCCTKLQALTRIPYVPQAALCLPNFQCCVWYSLPQYTTALHRVHGFRATLPPSPIASATPQLAQARDDDDDDVAGASCFARAFAWA